jgi:hypothetical protein
MLEMRTALRCIQPTQKACIREARVVFFGYGFSWPECTATAASTRSAASPLTSACHAGSGGVRDDGVLALRNIRVAVAAKLVPVDAQDVALTTGIVPDSHALKFKLFGDAVGRVEYEVYPFCCHDCLRWLWLPQASAGREYVV